MSKIYSEHWMADQGFFDASHSSTQKIEYIKTGDSK
jgi:hypothetical protein